MKRKATFSVEPASNGLKRRLTHVEWSNRASLSRRWLPANERAGSMEEWGGCLVWLARPPVASPSNRIQTLSRFFGSRLPCLAAFWRQNKMAQSSVNRGMIGSMGDDHARTAGDHNEGPETPALTGDDRDMTAEDRDMTADAHDRASEARDERAEARDERAEARDQDVTRFDAEAASDRAGAKRDRRGASGDRSHASHDREAASTDRVISAKERKASSIDQLTGAYRRDTGLVELERELLRAKRTKQPFVLAFVDVDNFKATNDSLGHVAGDQLLRHIVDTMRAHLRSYDLIVRFGGDEFLCALSDLSVAQASRRFLLVRSDLARVEHASVTVGLAELRSDDSLEDLISRADAALYRKREPRRSILRS